ncbi:MAG: hypothetical protein P8N02_07245, partial [Actinomycetota bacterium]|nr:hypothetical protein [Actinomycetota bacterium]
HTPFMSPARDRLRKALAEVDIRAPAVPVVANVDATPRDTDDEWHQLLASQLCSPVQWRRSLYALEEQGVTTFVELGPGTVLTGMAKRTVKGSTTISVGTPADVDALLSSLADAADSGAVASDGENLYVTERLVVSPCSGLFTPNPDLADCAPLAVGDVVGTVAGEEVRSPFAGIVMGIMAVEGERVTSRQPIAWLRSS